MSTSKETNIIITTPESTTELTYSRDDLKSLVHSAEDNMKNMEAIEIPVTHHFSKDVYAREIKIPAGSYVVGKIHKYQNLNILSQGKISLISIDGFQTIEAPYTVVSSPGVKRLAYAHTDVIWTTIHGTSETDVDEIEKVFIVEDYSDVVELEKEVKKCLG